MSARGVRRLTVLVGVIMTVTLVTGCARTSEPVHPAAATLTGLLELRREGSADAEAYAVYFADPALATALAESVGEVGSPAIPPWESIEVSSEATQGAEVLVRWRTDEAFPGWAEATVFRMHEEAGRWIVDDAADASGDATP